MKLSLQLTPKLVQIQRQECGLCGHPGIKHGKDMKLLIGLMGGLRTYEHCPHCGYGTQEISQDPIWQLQVDLYKELKEEVNYEHNICTD